MAGESLNKLDKVIRYFWTRSWHLLKYLRCMILSSLSATHCNTQECIRIDAKGVILGRCVARRLGVKEGDCVNIFRDITHKGDLYIAISSAASGYPLHKRAEQYHLHSRDLARLILTEAGVISGNTALFKVGEAIEYDGAMVLPIITRINYANI